MAWRVLVLDDDADWRATYREVLGEEGHDVVAVATRAEAEAEALAQPVHVVVLDQKLEGPGGRDSGLGLLPWLRDHVPSARALLVTAYPHEAAVERAFREGVFDYLQKGTAIFEPLLRVKVRQAAEAAALAWGRRPAEALEAELRATWADALAERQSQRKGSLLERAVRLLFETIPGFTHARTNVGNETEEIDVLVTNRSTDPLLARQGDFLVVECKNWTGTVGTAVVGRLMEKVRKRYGRAHLGICVAVGGFAGTVERDLLAERRGDDVVLLLDREAMEGWIAATDRAEWLVQRIGEAVEG